MVKFKIGIILIIGLLVAIYNLINFNVFASGSEQLTEVLLQSHINTMEGEGLIGIYFDYFVSLLFNIDLGDSKAYLKIFGV